MAKKFINWARTQVSSPGEWHEISSEEEAISLVKHAVNSGCRVKIVGSGHSWSSIACPDEIAVTMNRMNRLVHIDKQKMEVTVQGGMKLKDLNRLLYENGLAMSILGSVSEQTVAGVTATGTHGSSLKHGNISTFITSVKWIDGQGKVRQVSGDDPLLNAITVHLGAIGLITEITFRVEPAFNLLEEGIPVLFEEGVKLISEMARESEYVKWWWLPHTPYMQIFRYSRSHQPPNDSRAKFWFDEKVINRIVFPGLIATGRVISAFIPPVNRLVRRVYFAPSNIISQSDRAFNLALPPVHREMEYAVNWEKGTEVFRKFRSMVEERKHRVNFIAELRAVKADQNWMSPAYGRDSAHIGAYMAHTRGINYFFEESQRLLESEGGRPHWGKEMKPQPGILKLYPRGEDFRNLVFDLDPHGVFANPFLDNLLGTRERSPAARN